MSITSRLPHVSTTSKCVCRIVRSLERSLERQIEGTKKRTILQISKRALHNFPKLYFGRFSGKLPRNHSKLVEVKGIKSDRAKWYGPDILAVIDKFISSLMVPSTPTKKPRTSSVVVTPNSRRPHITLNKIQKDRLTKDLSELRDRCAKREKIEHYKVFTDTTLIELIDKLPTTLNELVHVHGIKEIKAAKYGSDMIRIVHVFLKLIQSLDE